MQKLTSNHAINDYVILTIKDFVTAKDSITSHQQ